MEEGIALVRGQKQVQGGKPLEEIILLDTSETWQSDMEVKSSYDMVGYEYGNHHIYLLFGKAVPIAASSYWPVSTSSTIR